MRLTSKGRYAVMALVDLARFDGINNKLNKLDTRLWGIYGVIIGVAVLEKFF